MLICKMTVYPWIIIWANISTSLQKKQGDLPKTVGEFHHLKYYFA